MPPNLVPSFSAIIVDKILFSFLDMLSRFEVMRFRMGACLEIWGEPSLYLGLQAKVLCPTNAIGLNITQDLA